MTNAGSGTSDAAVLKAIVEHRAPAVGTNDIADAVGVTRQAADKRLRNLEEDELVERYKVGRDVVWYLTPAGERYAKDIADN